jgi:Co/Zn/Cd efflux system component
MGVLGGALVAIWAVGLIRDTAKVLLDAESNPDLNTEVREVIAACDKQTEISDIHIWRVGKAKYSCILTLVTDSDASPDYYREKLSIHEELAHVVIEINHVSAS